MECLLPASPYSLTHLPSPQHQFVVDEVSTIIKESIETVIGGNAYTSAKVNNWTSQVVENVLGNLSKLNKAFKYIGEWSGTWVCCILKPVVLLFMSFKYL